MCRRQRAGEKKPAPDIYLMTLELLGLGANECVAIEDSRNGLLSACRAGIATVVTPGMYTDDQLFDEAALVTESLSGITTNALYDLINGHERPVSHRAGY